MARAAEADWSLDAAHAADDAPVVDERDLDGATAYLGLSQAAGDELAFLGRQAQSDWEVGLPAFSTLSVDANLNAARGDIDLGVGPVKRVSGTLNASEAVLDLAEASAPERVDIELTLNAADVRLLLPNADISARVTLNASSLTVCVPSSMALRVESSSILSGDDLAASGLVEGNPTLWTTPGFSAAVEHIDLSVSSTASVFSLERPETCS